MLNISVPIGVAIEGEVFSSTRDGKEHHSLTGESTSKLEWENGDSSLVIRVGSGKVNRALRDLRKELVNENYFPFISKMTDGHLSSNYDLSIIKAENQFEIISFQGTEAGNYSISNDDIIKKLKEWDASLGIEIIGAGDDWLSFFIKKMPEDIGSFVEKELYSFCPDMIHQGRFAEHPKEKAIEMEADVIRYQKFVYLWWD